MIQPEDIIAGRMPENENEIIVDKSIIQREIEKPYNSIKMCGIINVEDMLNKEVTIQNMQPFTIVGLVDTESPTIYANENMFINIIANSQDVEEVGGFGYMGVMYTDEAPAEGEAQILDYKLFENKITLKDIYK